MDELTSFGDWLRRRRKALDLTQAELAQRVGCAEVTIQKLEADERRPSREIAVRLAHALKVPPTEQELFIRCARGERAADRLPVQAAATSIPAVVRPPTRPRPPLAAPLTPLIGRAHAVAAISLLVQRPDVRLVTLTGTGGIGKTRLACQVAADLQADFADGVALVELAALSDPQLVAPTIARTFDLHETGGQDSVAQLQAYLRAKHFLLVLDNFEHLLPAAPLVTDLLRAVPRLTVLVTSRAVLRLSGEHEFPVPPLALPDAQMPPDALAENEAVRLFVARAQAVTPDFQLTAANGAAIAAICRHLEGLPLALELAAARSKLFAPETLLRRLSQRLHVLTGGPRDLPARQQTIRATIDWSYHLLSAAEQRLFRRLAVFMGGCTLDAAEAVGNLTGDLDLDVPDGVQALVDQSLLRHEAGVDGAPRFGMFETIAEYARERLQASDEEAMVRRQHALYYLTLVEALAPKLHGPEQIVVFQQLEMEHDNLRAALRQVQAEGAAELGWRLCHALLAFWERRGDGHEARRWIEAVLTLPEVGTAALPVARRAEVLLFAATRAGEQHAFVQEQALLQESLALSRAAGDPGSTAKVLLYLVQVADRQGDVARQHALLEESLALFQAAGDIQGSAQALYQMSLIAALQGDPARERAYLEESLVRTRQIADQRQRAAVLLQVGSRERWKGDSRGGAAALLEESLALFRELQDQAGSAEALAQLGATLRDLGAYARAQALLEESVALFQALGEKPACAAALHDLGETLLLQGDALGARVPEEESVALFEEIGARLSLAFPLLDLGHIAKHEGDYGQAFAYLSESLAILRDAFGAPGPAVASCLSGFAGVASRQRQAQRAARLFGAATGFVARFAMHGQLFFPAHQREMECDVAATRTQLDEASFAAAWTEGRTMTLEQAIAYALQDEPTAN